MPDLRQRCRLPELMDDPQLDASQHLDALCGLQRVNVLSRSASLLWPEILRTACEVKDRPLRILDIASGGGDIAIAIAARCWASGVETEIEGWDLSPVAVQRATEQAAQRKPGNVRFAIRDAINESADATYNIVMCSLFLHHLAEDDAHRLLARMKQMATHNVLINDLRRTRIGYLLAWAGCRLLTRSPIVHTDGPLSVRAAFSLDEVRRLADDCGLAGAELTTHWPQRFLLSWRPGA
ncbi:methyltransferase domain-containing protein [bacterium]|nr:methyltransferase domain-containing protein [bacterium]